MARIGVRELRQNASKYLARVRNGEVIEVTQRGRLVALLTPPTDARTTRDRLIAQGLLIPASAHWEALQRIVAPPGASSEEIFEDLRRDRL